MDCYYSLARKSRSAAEQCESFCVLDSRFSGYLENHWQQLKKKEEESEEEEEEVIMRKGLYTGTNMDLPLQPLSAPYLEKF